MQSYLGEAEVPAESPLRSTHHSRATEGRANRRRTAEPHSSSVQGSSSPLPASATSPSMRSHSAADSLGLDSSPPSSPIVPRPGDGSGGHDEESPWVRLLMRLQELCSKSPGVRQRIQNVWSDYQARARNHGISFGRDNLTDAERDEIQMMRRWLSECDELISLLINLVEEHETMGCQIILTYRDEPQSNNPAPALTEDEATLDDSLQVDTPTTRRSLFRLLDSTRRELQYSNDELANLTNRMNVQRHFRPERSAVDEAMDLSDEEEYLDLLFDVDKRKARMQNQQDKISSLKMQLGISSEESFLDIEEFYQPPVRTSPG